jgi:hypothetical protein
MSGRLHRAFGATGSETFQQVAVLRAPRFQLSLPPLAHGSFAVGVLNASPRYAPYYGLHSAKSRRWRDGDTHLTFVGLTYRRHASSLAACNPEQDFLTSSHQQVRLLQPVLGRPVSNQPTEIFTFLDVTMGVYSEFLGRPLNSWGLNYANG